jgi:hypothetical protein
MKQQVLPLRLSETRDEFDLSALDNLNAPLVPILFSTLSENVLTQQVTAELKFSERSV